MRWIAGDKHKKSPAEAVKDDLEADLRHALKKSEGIRDYELTSVALDAARAEEHAIAFQAIDAIKSVQNRDDTIKSIFSGGRPAFTTSWTADQAYQYLKRVITKESIKHQWNFVVLAGYAKDKQVAQVKDTIRLAGDAINVSDVAYHAVGSLVGHKLFRAAFECFFLYSDSELSASNHFYEFVVDNYQAFKAQGITASDMIRAVRILDATVNKRRWHDTVIGSIRRIWSFELSAPK